LSCDAGAPDGCMFSPPPLPADRGFPLGMVLSPSYQTKVKSTMEFSFCTETKVLEAILLYALGNDQRRISTPWFEEQRPGRFNPGLPFLRDL
jgi:hypothetical protein